MAMPDPLADELKKHLDSGGSALVIVAPQAQGLDKALEGWGIIPRADLVAVHEPIRGAEDSGAARDEVVDARRRQYVFDLREYGDHAITRPLRSLESLIVPILPVETKKVEGVNVTPILPVPSDVPSWGESDFSSLQNERQVIYEKDSDKSGPLFGGAAAERNGHRLVVIGSPTFAFNFELSMVDPELERQEIYVSRFPANGELFMNSIFWLAKMDPAIAISPAAMEVSRIKPMSAGVLNLWRVGVLLIGIPGSVVVAGLLVYFKRRD
jgi:hypothetical protein